MKEEVQKENPSSLRSISNDFPGASHTYVMELAREIYPEEKQLDLDHFLNF